MRLILFSIRQLKQQINVWVMDKGIKILELNQFFENEENQGIKNNYMGVYSMDSIIRYIKFYEIIKKRNGKYPLTIFNTDKHNKPGTHWWKFMDIHPKNIYYYLKVLD